MRASHKSVRVVASFDEQGAIHVCEPGVHEEMNWSA